VDHLGVVSTGPHTSVSVRTVTSVMHLTFSDKNLLVGDELAQVLIDYTAALASAKLGDSVTVNAIGADGDAVKAMLLLDTGAPVMAETTHSDLPEPDNDAVVEYMKLKTLELEPPRAASVQEQDDMNLDANHFE
jgi:hypothetical protein